MPDDVDAVVALIKEESLLVAKKESDATVKDQDSNLLIATVYEAHV